MRTKILISAAAAFLLCAQTPPSRAAGYKADWVESEVVLSRGGGAAVSYTVKWTASGGELHGFWFEGFQGDPVFDESYAYALDAAGNRYPLSIRRVDGRKYDIVLADGRAFTDGTITYYFRYTTDLKAAGAFKRVSEGGRDLLSFDWSPVLWRDSLEYQAVTVWLPVLSAGKAPGPDFFESIGFEPDRSAGGFGVDFTSAGNSSGDHVPGVRFFKRGIDGLYRFRVRFSMDARALAPAFEPSPAAPAAVKKAPPPAEAPAPTKGPPPAEKKKETAAPAPAAPAAPAQPQSRGGSFFLTLTLAALLCAVLLAMTVKHRSMLTARRGLSEADWEGKEWTPQGPRSGDFRKPGLAVSTLSPAEAGLLLDMPVGELASLILANMERKKLVRIEAVEPLRLERTEAARSSDPYEAMMLDAVGTDGNLDKDAVGAVINTIAAGLEQKLWNADPAATKARYKKILDAYRPGRADTDTDYYWGGFRRRFNGYINPVYARVGGVNKDLGGRVPEFAGPFGTFRNAQARYEGAFSRTACDAACRSDEMAAAGPRKDRGRGHGGQGGGRS